MTSDEAENTQAFVLHSRPAHQTLGWCGRCPDRSFKEEATAWRDHAVTSLAPVALRYQEPTGWSSHINATAQYEVCARCQQDTLVSATVTASDAVGVTITASSITAEEMVERPIGGWALCLGCGAAPHPLREPTDG